MCGKSEKKRIRNGSIRRNLAAAPVKEIGIEVGFSYMIVFGFSRKNK